MQVLIIEDESRAVNQLKNMLETCGFDFQLMDVIDTVEDSVLWFQKHSTPDLVFMDVQLADGLSFEIFQSVDVPCPIIFTTAFDQYALQAFKVNSVDYLLKPVQLQDLQNALDKFKRSKKAMAFSAETLKKLLREMGVSEKRQGILVKDGDGYVQLKIEDILYFYSEDSTTFGVTSKRRYIIDETVDELYQTLDPDQYFRINRGQIVSKSSIEKIGKYFNHRLKLSMINSRDQEFIVSRQKTNDFKNWLNR